MHTSAPAVSSAFWLPEPATDVVGQEKPKTKPVQTEVETQLWKICQETANPNQGWVHALIYSLFAGAGTVTVVCAFQVLYGLLANGGLDNAVNKFFQ